MLEYFSFHKAFNQKTRLLVSGYKPDIFRCLFHPILRRWGIIKERTCYNDYEGPKNNCN